MRLRARDGVETLLVAAAVTVALAVTQGWGWPLLGSPRAGIVALAIIGQGMCSVAGWTRGRLGDPFIVLGSVLGVVVLGVIVGGLIAGTDGFVTALAGALLVLWLIATVHHAVWGGSYERPAFGA